MLDGDSINVDTFHKFLIHRRVSFCRNGAKGHCSRTSTPDTARHRPDVDQAADEHGTWAGESGQDIQHRIIFIARRKGKFGIPTNGRMVPTPRQHC